MAAAGGPGGACVHLPPKYVLRRRHVEDAVKGVPDDACDVTVWIHNSTQGIEKNCFSSIEWVERVSRILVWGQEPHDDGTHPPFVAAAVLGAFVAKLAAYEPALVDHIHQLVATHMGNDDEMHRIGDCAFMGTGYSALREVVLTRSITHVGRGAFWGCTSLTSVTLPNSLTYIGAHAFYQCTSLTSVALPASLTYLGDCAFWGCTSLTSVTLPDSLTHIGESAFYGCTSLARVMMPAVRPFVGEQAFEGCRWPK
jgi:hypothetical protein